MSRQSHPDCRAADIPHNGGNLLTPHLQGLVWGKLSIKDQSRIGKLFSGGFDGATGVRLTAVNNFAGAIAYMVKAPLCGYARIESPDGKIRRPIDQFHGPLRFRVFQLFHRFKFADLTLAGGQGVAVRAAAMEEAGKLRATPTFKAALALRPVTPPAVV